MENEYYGQTRTGSSPKMSAIAREIASSFQGLIRSEFNLTRVELGDTARGISRRFGQTLAFAFIAYLGILALLAGGILALGDVLESYAQSALIIGGILGAGGAIMAYRSMREIREQEKLPETQRSFHRDQDLLSRKVQEFKQVTRERGYPHG